MRFAQPVYLYLLLLIPLLAGLYVYASRQRKKNLSLLGDEALLHGLMGGSSLARLTWKFICLLMAFLLAVLMLARPQLGTRMSDSRSTGIELIVALDVSNSMLAADLEPNRLEKAKQLTARLMDKMQGNRVGLILFAGDAYTQIPLTADFVSVKMFMPVISPALIPFQGTAIGKAIEQAGSMLSKGENEQNIGRSVLIITDGENHEDDAIAAAKAVAGKDITVNVIGMGAERGAPIPLENGEGFRRDRRGNIVLSGLNTALCRNIAKAGGGVFIHADNTNHALSAIEEELDRLSKGKIETRVYAEYSEQFQWFAALLILFLLIELFISGRRVKWLKRLLLFNR